MKKAILILLLPVCFHAKAQSDNENKTEKKRFPKEKLFTGGSLNLGLSNYGTTLGIAPQFGYSLSNWADAGITLSVNYNSLRDVYSPAKIRQTIYGPGAFVRLFPVNFLFGTAQYEYNMIHLKNIPGDGSASYSQNVSAGSLLLGGGYAGGRYRGSNTYYFISVMWDVLGDKNSPYVDGYGRAFPVIRAGYNIGLFQGKNRRYKN
ncbi:MAG: hypothetical protein M3Z26_18015 [Bacteroidota bacterium]|nr:hypothetical protein [Bacteroidota bacterium]